MDDSDDPEYCGVGIRGVSMLVDSFVWLVAFFVGIFVVGAATGDLQGTSAGASAQLEGPAAVAGLGLFLALGIGYHAVLEWRYGQTLGKHLVKIEVTTDDGSPLTLRDSLVRNALRIVDWLPFLYAIGIVSVLESDRRERLGDRVADTVVVRV